MITFKNVTKTFKDGNITTNAVKDCNLHIKKGSIFGIIGYSGAGKSTLVRCINLLERPTSGTVLLGDIDLTALSKEKLREQRKRIGMIFQQFNLLSQKNVYKNIAYPLEISKTEENGTGKRVKLTKTQINQKVSELLKLVGLTDKAKSYPSQLSGGQKQRVAIARALATNPEVLLCDEATSALDPNTTNQILDLLKDINKKLGVTIVIITHEMKVVQKICDEVAVIDDGQIVETGSMEQLFLNPKSKMARKLILPDKESFSDYDKFKVIRIVFDGQSSFEPVVSNLVMRCQIPVNIMGAKTDDVGGKAFGQMLLQYPADETSANRIKNYLDSVNVKYEEVENDVR